MTTISPEKRNEIAWTLLLVDLRGKVKASETWPRGGQIHEKLDSTIRRFQQVETELRQIYRILEILNQNGGNPKIVETLPSFEEFHEFTRLLAK
jgi:hypothetical protein